ncbi:glycoside hydrolase family 25 protein [Corynebacterium cystitidis]|uniref:Lyzozyme M1 (1,4-beta-N-acetylmuramidase), GH25 family n=1 Tax=Corynebacterium cystitidis DSM 20524 TaxID=1121357 RepID=A0A1H9S5R5_9CORY|nr:glycoside hydrolase family 25 protein [Corynebacterium cystitidis]WJY82196.1 Lysozyme M1 precursor [Corynebacterium cystitidis DSM 20524]SER79499.1 Lyzozyme M1 (1,4-beta-N-acetylmuramidase), GH25 family [Corynebacterium cystitidis DSM 20524]SNV77963.1 lysozyme M1 [Corynebacterium cystitidis]
MRLSLKMNSVIAAIAMACALLAVPFSPHANAFTNPLAPSGVDVAGHQHPGGNAIEWSSVAADGQRYAFIKATEGYGFTNEFYAQDVEAANNAGLLTGAYHYARPATDPHIQAAHFATVMAQAPATSLPPVLDIEVSEGLSPVQLQDWTRTFLKELKALTGKTPMIYTYRYFWHDAMANTSEFSEYPLWLAAYQNHAPAPVGGWSTISFWQRSDNGRVAGIDTPVDMNLFNGSEGQLGAFAAGNLASPGGVLEFLQAPESSSLAVLGQDNTALVAAILAVGLGVAAAPALQEAAQSIGFDAEDASNIAGTVAHQVETGQLPVEDLENMVVGDYTVGDLLILLDNANKAAR